MKNIFIIDRDRFEQLRIAENDRIIAHGPGNYCQLMVSDIQVMFHCLKHTGMMLMDFVAVQEKDGGATLIKNRYTEHSGYIDSEIYNIIKNTHLH